MCFSDENNIVQIAQLQEGILFHTRIFGFVILLVAKIRRRIPTTTRKRFKTNIRTVNMFHMFIRVHKVVMYPTREGRERRGGRGGRRPTKRQRRRRGRRHRGRRRRPTTNRGTDGRKGERGSLENREPDCCIINPVHALALQMFRTTHAVKLVLPLLTSCRQLPIKKLYMGRPIILALWTENVSHAEPVFLNRGVIKARDVRKCCCTLYGESSCRMHDVDDLLHHEASQFSRDRAP
jgi:hypothetical protein